MRTARATSPCHSKKYCHNGAWPSPTHHGVGLPGVQEGDDGPFPLSLEHAVMQGKARGVRDPRPLGAGMDFSAFFPAGTSTATTGAWPSPTITPSACLGVHGGDHGPFRRSPETGCFAGEKPEGPGSTPFGVRNGHVFLFTAPKVLPQRGHGPRPPSGVSLPGVQEGDHGPFPRSVEQAVMQGEIRGVRDLRPVWVRRHATILRRGQEPP
jgi:hypothetical protein